MNCSIIICAHNPEPETFGCLLNAVSKLEGLEKQQVILVDNNSTPPLTEIKLVQEFIRQNVNAVVVSENKPGLTSARITGIMNATFEWLVFFDDDNEPELDYLTQIDLATKQYPKVGAWGPGIVNVKYPNEKYEKQFFSVKKIFQQRNESSIKTGNEIWWQDYYPAGTGLVIKKEVALKYSDLVLNNIYNLSDRKGKSLSSGGDLQMVLTAIKCGYNVGVHPALKINHNIDVKRLTPKYLRRLSFGTALSNIPGHLEVWGHDRVGNFSPPTTMEILKQLYHHFKVKLQRESLIEVEISFSNHLGTWGGIYETRPELRPLKIWKILCKFFRVK